jgi:hypothetical protein
MDTLERMQLSPLDESPNEGSSQSTIAIPLRYINMKMRTCDEKATAVFFNLPAEPHLSKRLLFSLTAKITRGARLEKNVVYVAKTASEISNFVCPLVFSPSS